MKKNIRHIVIDLEFTPIPKSYKELRAVCGHEIIEIGAVALDDKGRIKEEFRQFVKPEYSQLDVFCARLTGINKTQLADAPSFDAAMEKFVEWVGRRETEYYQWSGADLSQLTAECTLKGLTEKYSSVLNAAWTDVQQLFHEEVGFSNAFRLEMALDLLGVEVTGRLHDALVDAQNTAEILRILSNPAEKKKRTAYIKDYYKEEDQTQKEQTTTLGDLFAGLFTEENEDD